jgi:uncharacterized protein YlxW (UPF0749 family)
MCLAHNAQMLQTASEAMAKTRSLTASLDSTKKTLGKELNSLQKSYSHLEQKTNTVQNNFSNTITDTEKM